MYSLFYRQPPPTPTPTPPSTTSPDLAKCACGPRSTTPGAGSKPLVGDRREKRRQRSRPAARPRPPRRAPRRRRHPPITVRAGTTASPLHVTASGTAGKPEPPRQRAEPGSKLPPVREARRARLAPVPVRHAVAKGPGVLVHASRRVSSRGSALAPVAPVARAVPKVKRPDAVDFLRVDPAHVAVPCVQDRAGSAVGPLP